MPATLISFYDDKYGEFYSIDLFLAYIWFLSAVWLYDVNVIFCDSRQQRLAERLAQKNFRVKHLQNIYRGGYM